MSCDKLVNFVWFKYDTFPGYSRTRQKPPVGSQRKEAGIFAVLFCRDMELLIM